MGGCLLRARNSALAALTLIGAILLSLLACQHANVSQGTSWATLPEGGARAMFGFFLGVLLWRLRPRAVRSRAMPWIVAAALLTVFGLPDAGWQVDLLMVLPALPTILWLSIGLKPQRERLICRLLGEISYPLYVIHMPMLMLLAGWLQHRPALSDSGWIYLAELPILLAAWVAARYYDAPVRRLLSQGRAVRAEAPTPAVAGD